MQAFQVTTTAQKVISGGNRDFVHIQNISDSDIYFKYDGDSTALTTSNGFKLASGDSLVLNNDGDRNVFNKEIWAIHGASGNKEIRIQGA